MGGQGSYALVKGAKVTPLPFHQMVSMLLLQLCESMQVNILFPFLVFMVEDFGYKGEKLGLYAGFLAAAFCGAQFFSAVFWGKVSDRYGRRFALLCGAAGATIAVAYFGFASSYTHAVIARAISGLLNGNVGVLKSLMTEITDESNRAKAFGYNSLAWGLGTIIAPLVGGALCRPAQKYPSAFGHSTVFVEFPYLLPCLAVVLVQLVATIATHLYLTDPRPAGGVTKFWTDIKSLLQCRGLTSRNSHSSEKKGKAVRSKRKSGVNYEHVPSQVTASASGSFSSQLSLSGEYGHFVAIIEDDQSSVGTDIEMNEFGDDDQFRNSQKGGIEMVASCDSIATTTNTPVGSTVSRGQGSGNTNASHHHDSLTTSRTVSTEFDYDPGNDSDCDTVTFDLTSQYELEDQSPQGSTSSDEEQPFSLLRDRVVVAAVMNYGMLAMAYIIWDETLPMYFKLKASAGGLSMSSSEIGLSLTAGGAAVMLFTLSALPTLERWKGKFWLMNVGCWAAIPIACLWPVLTNVLLDGGKVAMWIVLCIVVCLKNVLCSMAFTAVTIMINHSVTDEYLGEVNGFGQTVAALARAIGPAVGGALWSLSTSVKFVYFNFLMAGLCLVGCVVITARLPRSLEHKPGAKLGDIADANEAINLPMH